MPCPRLAPLLALVALTAAPAAAQAYGTDPIPLSVGPGGEAANAPSGGGAVSGDNRKGRLAAFHSFATNLLGPADTNGAADVFVWYRPGGQAGLTLDRPARPLGRLVRASVGPGGRQANGPSLNPSLDGTVKGGTPHCVAFESRASNLASSDRDATSDIFVRDLRRGRTVHISRGVGAAATNPTIDGHCEQVSFEAGGRVYLGRVGGRPRSLGAGGDADLGMDGRSVAWVRGGRVLFRREGRTTQVAADGRRPQVTNRQVDLKWGVVFDTPSALTGDDANPGWDVYTRVVGRTGGASRTDLISSLSRGAQSFGGDSANGGISAYGARSGFVLAATTVGGRTAINVRNNNVARNTPPLAWADTLGGGPSIFDVATSSRSNFVIFSSTGTRRTNFRFDGNGAVQDVFYKHLVAGEPL